jgi:hypothetical protein
LSFSLRHRPQLVRALEYALSKGGTLVAHGHTHQTDLRPNPYHRVSGGDYEFFAADLSEGAFLLRGPLPNDNFQTWRARFEASKAAWRKAGLDHPSIFTFPHYAASPKAYQAARKHYPVRYERSLYFAGELDGTPFLNGDWETQHFPYEVVDVRGDLIIPENLGYSSTTERGGAFGRSPDMLVASARRNLVVRDGFASFFHHWYEDPYALQRTVRGIKALGYRFVAPQEVIDAAPAHAPRRTSELSPLAAASVHWVARLPELRTPLLIVLLSMIALLWGCLELLYRRLSRTKQRRPLQLHGKGGRSQHHLRSDS